MLVCAIRTIKVGFLPLLLLLWWLFTLEKVCLDLKLVTHDDGIVCFQFYLRYLTRNFGDDDDKFHRRKWTLFDDQIWFDDSDQRPITESVLVKVITWHSITWHFIFGLLLFCCVFQIRFHLKKLSEMSSFHEQLNFVLTSPQCRFRITARDPGAKSVERALFLILSIKNGHQLWKEPQR